MSYSICAVCRDSLQLECTSQYVLGSKEEGKRGVISNFERPNGKCTKTMQVIGPTTPFCYIREVVLKCSHVFHLECLQGWMNREHDTCPVCMARIYVVITKDIEETIPFLIPNIVCAVGGIAFFLKQVDISFNNAFQAEGELSFLQWSSASGVLFAFLNVLYAIEKGDERSLEQSTVELKKALLSCAVGGIAFVIDGLWNNTNHKK